MSARRTVDTDTITLRKVYARGTSNLPIAETLALTADGRGGTRWTHPSSLGAYTLNYISTDVSLIQWDLSLNNIFYLTGGQGIGIQSSVRNKYQSIVYSKAFQAFHDVNSKSTISVLDNPTTLYSTLNLSTTSWQIYPTLDSNTQTLYLNTNPIKFLVIPNISSIDTPNNLFGTSNEVNIDNVNSTIRLIGVGDIQISSVLTPQSAVYFSIKGITSESFTTLQRDVSSLQAFSTTMPYNYRDMIPLNEYNSLQAGPFTLSTPYTGIFTVNYTGTPLKAPTICTLQSTMGFPFQPAGSLGIAEPIQTFTEDGYTVTITESGITQYSGDAYLSSLSFNLAPYSTIINRDASTSILLNYTPSFLLPTYQTANANTDSFLITMSSFLMYGKTVVPGTSIETTFYTPNTPPRKNVVYPSLQIDIPKSFVYGNYSSNYYVYHYFPGAMALTSNTTNTWPPTWTTLQAGLSTTQANCLTGKNNLAVLSVIGL